MPKANPNDQRNKTKRENSVNLDECKPSEVTGMPWIYAKRKFGAYPTATERIGKWLVFVPNDEVDEVWAKIKQATGDGKLGGASKVATASNIYPPYPDTKVICVYTYDWTDEEDVKRVRIELRNLGITRKISYKSDQDTLSGKYRVTGHTRISKYYE